MIIKTENLTKKYGKGNTEIIALDNANFEIEEGELVVILGPSGAGKSTLLNLLGGMDIPTSGSMIINGVKIETLNKNKLTLFRREQIGFVFQFYNLISNLNVLENVEISASVSKNSKDPIETLTKVGLADRLSNFPSELSGGEQQRVAIARAIVKNPAVLLCDEPTGALDIKTGIDVLKLISDIARVDKKTVIIVTHNQEIAKIADRVIKLRDGKIVSNEIIKKPKKVSEIKW